MTEKKTFLEAWRACQYFGLQLASVRTKAENELLRNVVVQPEHSTSTFWLAGTDLGWEGRWIWITNNSPLVIFGVCQLRSKPEINHFLLQVTFSNWAFGNPDNSNNQDCMIVGSNANDPTMWDDVQCTDKHKYICEKTDE